LNIESTRIRQISNKASVTCRNLHERLSFFFFRLRRGRFAID